MPLVNIYFQQAEATGQLQKLTPDLKKFLAEKLTCGDISLSPSEISVRFIDVVGGDMIAEIELEIAAHSFPERVKKQDQICLEVMQYFQKKTGIENVRVWLQLSELGHSW